MITKLTETKKFLSEKINNNKPEIGLVLGSGLGVLAEQIANKNSIEYGHIPHFPVSTVEGHAGQLVFGTLAGKNVVAMQGRFHFYEGYNMSQVTYPIRIMKMLGVKTLIVTNAAGGVNTNFEPGDLMVISDHINLMGSNPLIGANVNELGQRFPDMSEAYAKQLRKLAFQVATKKQLVLEEGIYAGVMGPSYETPAEIRYLRHIGADAVGMSTVPEVIVANHCGMKVLGISCITNMAAGVLEAKLSHDEVMETAAKVKEDFVSLIEGILEEI
ncbi:MAG: purine-nucleoside phosphorylase [Bacillota bacterium]|nr:purine-nucleoside phosphorylase [Bacillota bacterium]